MDNAAERTVLAFGSLHFTKQHHEVAGHEQNYKEKYVQTNPTLENEKLCDSLHLENSIVRFVGVVCTNMT